MKINVTYIGLKNYHWGCYNQWFWMFKRYTYIKGFIIRIFGVYINVRENDSSEKMIKIWHENKKE